MGWSLWLGCEYSLTEWVGQLWGEVCDWVANTESRGEWGIVGWGLWMCFDYRLTERVWQLWNKVCDCVWIQTGGLSGKPVCDWVVNTDRRSEWDSCGVWFVIWFRIQIDRMSRTAVEGGLWLDVNTERRSDWETCGEFCDCFVNTDWRGDWNSRRVRFMILCEFRSTDWVGQLCGEFCD
jgi:hypothetical protein